MNHFLNGFSDELTKIALKPRDVKLRVARGVANALKKPGGKERVAKFQRRMTEAEAKAAALAEKKEKARRFQSQMAHYGIGSKENTKLLDLLPADKLQQRMAQRKATKKFRVALKQTAKSQKSTAVKPRSRTTMAPVPIRQ